MAKERMAPYREAEHVNSDNSRNPLIYWGGSAAGFMDRSEPTVLAPRQHGAEVPNTDNRRNPLIYWGGSAAEQGGRSAT